MEREWLPVKWPDPIGPEWTELKTSEDCMNLQKLYGDFEDAYLISYRFDSHNYVDVDLSVPSIGQNRLYLLFQREFYDPFSIELLFDETERFYFNSTVRFWYGSIFTPDIGFAQIFKTDDYFYWTDKEDFDPRDVEHTSFADSTFVEAKRLYWRIVKMRP